MSNNYFYQNINNGNRNLLSFLNKELAQNNYDNVSICAAYATVRGIRAIRSLFSNTQVQTKWLLGLDDYITEAEAITTAMDSLKSSVRVIKMLPSKRFHPKIYLLYQSDKNKATLIIGSNNLTSAGLNKNCEAYMVLRCNQRSEVRDILKFWSDIWNNGKQITKTEIETYKDKRRVRKPILREVIEESIDKAENRIITSNERPKMLKTSKTVWIVLGRNTGGGNQLDIVKDMAPFLYLPSNPSEGTSIELKIKTLLGRKQYKLTFTKGMWRFMGLQKGFDKSLRPDLSEPSPYLLVIEKNDNHRLSMRLIKLKSNEASTVMAKSQEIGFIGISTPGKGGRTYGWF